jgi:hypothetical protein
MGTTQRIFCRVDMTITHTAAHTVCCRTLHGKFKVCNTFVNTGRKRIKNKNKQCKKEAYLLTYSMEQSPS